MRQEVSDDIVMEAYNLYADQHGFTGDRRSNFFRAAANPSTACDAFVEFADEHGYVGELRDNYLAGVPLGIPRVDIVPQLFQLAAERRIQEITGVDLKEARRIFHQQNGVNQNNI